MAPQVFVSYSHDSDLHRTAVLSFCARLRADGINVISDHFIASPPEGWPRWMQRQIESSTFVLLAITENYKRRFEGRECQSGKGATFEGFLVTQEVYSNNCRNKRFIPILFTSEDLAHVPAILQSATCYNVKRSAEYVRLYAALTSQSLIELPEIGDLRKVSATAIQPHEFEDKDSEMIDLLDQPTTTDTDPIATQIDTCVIELTIQKDFRSFSLDDERELIDLLKKLLDIKKEIKVVSKFPGSVLLSLEMPSDKAEQLYWLVNRGELHASDIMKARLLSEEEVETMKVSSAASQVSQEERGQTICRIANETYGKTRDWVVFFREILGVNGLVRRLYPTAEELASFEKTPEYADIQKMVKRLRDKPAAAEGQEVTRVITVRLPASLHEFLKAEARDRKTSINQLCMSKLLQAMNDDVSSTGRAAS